MPTSPLSEGQPLASSSVATVSPDSSAKLRHNLISLSAAAMFFSFFLPWITFLGAKLNGLDIQRNFSSYQLVWLMPLFAAAVLLLNIVRLNTGLIRRLAGLCPFVILVYATNRIGSDLYKELEYGAWLALVAGAALVFIPGGTKPTTPT